MVFFTELAMTLFTTSQDGGAKVDTCSYRVWYIEWTRYSGASLNGKIPCQLNVIQLKRWLVCCGGPFGGNKPLLVERWLHCFKASYLPSTHIG